MQHNDPNCPIAADPRNETCGCAPTKQQALFEAIGIMKADANSLYWREPLMNGKRTNDEVTETVAVDFTPAEGGALYVSFNEDLKRRYLIPLKSLTALAAIYDEEVRKA